MESDVSLFMMTLSVFLLVISIIEVYRSVLILFTNKKPNLLALRITLAIYNIFPFDMEKRRIKMMKVYNQRIKLYAVFTLIGGIIFSFTFAQTIITFFSN